MVQIKPNFQSTGQQQISLFTRQIFRLFDAINFNQIGKESMALRLQHIISSDVSTSFTIRNLSLNVYLIKLLLFLRWVDTNKQRLWDSQPTCRGPGDLGGSLLKDMTFDNLCEGQWASMTNLSPRIPIKNKLNEELKENFTLP